MRLALCVEYDGRGFCGFQSQPEGCGVQDALERGLSTIADETVRVSAAGRTDAGVHATALIVHFESQALRRENAWVRGVNAHLPAQATVLWAQEADAAFHARFSATQRHYTYLLQNRPQRPGLNAGRVGWYHHPLDADSMRDAAGRLLGTHDFSAFRAAECQARSPVKNVVRADVTVHDDMIRFDFSANAFLQHMIRNVVGTLVCVGAGRKPSSWVDQLLDQRDRTQAAPTFAPDGLYFTGATYPPQFAFPFTRRDVPVPA